MSGAPEADRVALTEAARQLGQDGYCVLSGTLPTATMEWLADDLAPVFERTPHCIGDFYGPRTKRFGGLLSRSPHAEELVRHPLVLALAERTLLPWCDRIALNLTQAVEIHPGAPAQFPHRDQDMWGGAKGELEYLVNVMWPLVPFTATNGATRLWPGSHRGDPHDQRPESEAVAIEMMPGDALLFLGSTLHGGGSHVSDAARRGIIVSYCLGWLKPFELQWLVYPPAIAKTFNPELAALVGYAQHRPNLGNYEGQCPSILLGSGVTGPLAATDALRPDQAAALHTFVVDGTDA